MNFTRNGLWLTSGNTSNNIVGAVATGQLHLASTTMDVCIDAGGQQSVMRVGSNAVIVNANLDVHGAINSIEANDLYIRDRLVCVANADGTYNGPVISQDGAGLMVGSASKDGLPDETSIRWWSANASNANASQQPLWDVRGGALGISRTMPSGRVVSFSFSVNDESQLEVTRITHGNHRQRVAVFGRSGPPITLPTSLNPYYS